MAALERAVMVNIQSHTNTVLEFPPVGIVRFQGDNSHGKSVLVKVLNDVVSNAITRPGARRSIIRRGHSYGELFMQRTDGVTLFVRIAREAADTYAELRKPDMPPVRRYLADKAIPLLVREFGWHYDADHGVSINIHNDTDGFLFVDTKKSTNFDLLNSVRSDQFAEAAADSLTETLKQSKKQREDFQHAYDVAQAVFVTLQYYDIAEETRIRDQCLFLAKCIEMLDMPEMPKLTIFKVPQFQVLLPPMPVLHFPKFQPPMVEPMPNLLPTLETMKSLLDGVCPTCERPFIERSECH